MDTKKQIVIKIIAIVMQLTFSFNGYCQQLKVGDKCPPILITNLLNKNYAIQTDTISSGLIIIDYWGTGCSSCIGAFPHLDSLQHKFGDSIRIISVNAESLDSTRRFFKRMHHLKIPDIPLASGDSLIGQLFPHNFLPWHIWIDKDKVIRHISAGFNTNEQNIHTFLKEKPLNLVEYKYNSEKQSVGELLLSPQTINYSYLAHYDNGKVVGNKTIISPSQVEICMEGVSIADLYIKAYSSGDNYQFLPKETVRLVSATPQKYTRPSDDKLNEWLKTNCYSYTILVRHPSVTREEVFKYMREDLARNFQIKASVEKQEIECYVLTKSTQRDLLKSKGGTPSTNFWKETTDTTRYLKNLPFHKFIEKLQSRMLAVGINVPLVNETNYHGTVDIIITKNELDWPIPENLDMQLQKYGLRLVKRRIIHKVLVLDDSR